MTAHPKIVCLMGPTASGKTQLAIDLVQRYPFEIISVDSALVYRGMDIGTAKPTPDILKIAPHRLINIRDPDDVYSAAQFREDALHEIKDILQQGKIPLLVGGTMLYFKALQQGLTDLPSADPEVRAKLTAEAELLGWPALHQRLAAIDSVSAQRIHPHDAQRIQRALEVFELTQKSLTDWHADEEPLETQYDIYNLAITPLERFTLHDRIEKRFKAMLQEGFLDEVQGLMNQYHLNADLPSMRSVGYRQALEYLAGILSYEEMTERSIIATRQFAKRQLTWLRNWETEICWLDSLDENLLANTANFLKNKAVI